MTGARLSYFSDLLHLQVCFALLMSNVGLVFSFALLLLDIASGDYFVQTC